MKFFEDKGIRGKYLKVAYNHLVNIFLARAESERTFTAAGKFYKNISMANNASVDTVCFLN